ncbi:MAG: hypothetical protein FWH14_00660 [Oscillospiraceae bacterium]|nr:hypothetical protein [Oscillospiraceae bacterium]
MKRFIITVFAIMLVLSVASCRNNIHSGSSHTSQSGTTSHSEEPHSTSQSIHDEYSGDNNNGNTGIDGHTGATS